MSKNLVIKFKIDDECVKMGSKIFKKKLHLGLLNKIKINLYKLWRRKLIIYIVKMDFGF